MSAPGTNQPPLPMELPEPSAPQMEPGHCSEGTFNPANYPAHGVDMGQISKPAPDDPAHRGVLPILPKDFAARLATRAGQPYRPSNGTEGDYFHAAACARCTKWERATDPDDTPEGCMIELRALFHSTDDPEYPTEWVYGPDGQPTCTAFDEEQASK